jgi:hypothetical protein
MTNITMIPAAERRMMAEARRQRMIRQEKIAHVTALALLAMTVGAIVVILL